MGQGNIFTPGLSFCSQEGMPSPGGAPGPGGVCSGEVGGYLVGGCLIGAGGCLVPGGSAPGGAYWRPPPDGYCCRLYVSYWNAFLLLHHFEAIHLASFNERKHFKIQVEKHPKKRGCANGVSFPQASNSLSSNAKLLPSVILISRNRQYATFVGK